MDFVLGLEDSAIFARYVNKEELSMEEEKKEIVRNAISEVLEDFLDEDCATSLEITLNREFQLEKLSGMNMVSSKTTSSKYYTEF